MWRRSTLPTSDHPAQQGAAPGTALRRQALQLLSSTGMVSLLHVLGYEVSVGTTNAGSIQECLTGSTSSSGENLHAFHSPGSVRSQVRT